ncbi:MAG: hypothetical protein LJE75_08770 [Gammaproteobacteria bacterium]|nr:hypothetical protein [Gammaproteobacteria bacterium]
MSKHKSSNSAPMSTPVAATIQDGVSRAEIEVALDNDAPSPLKDLPGKSRRQLQSTGRPLSSQPIHDTAARRR